MKCYPKYRLHRKPKSIIMLPISIFVVVKQDPVYTQIMKRTQKVHLVMAEWNQMQQQARIRFPSAQIRYAMYIYSYKYVLIFHILPTEFNINLPRLESLDLTGNKLQGRYHMYMLACTYSINCLALYFDDDFNFIS